MFCRLSESCMYDLYPWYSLDMTGILILCSSGICDLWTSDLVLLLHIKWEAIRILVDWMMAGNYQFLHTLTLPTAFSPGLYLGWGPRTCFSVTSSQRWLQCEEFFSYLNFWNRGDLFQPRLLFHPPSPWIILYLPNLSTVSTSEMVLHV